MSLRCLFIATTYLAIVCAGMAFPSAAWVAGFLLANVCMAVYAAGRAVVSPEVRPFWLGYLAGVGALFIALSSMRRDILRNAVAGPLASWIHGPFSPMSNDDSAKFSNIQDITKLALLIAVPFVVAMVMKALLRKRDSEA